MILKFIIVNATMKNNRPRFVKLNLDCVLLNLMGSSGN